MPSPIPTLGPTFLDGCAFLFRLHLNVLVCEGHKKIDCCVLRNVLAFLGIYGVNVLASMTIADNAIREVTSSSRTNLTIIGFYNSIQQDSVGLAARSRNHYHTSSYGDESDRLTD